MSSYEAAAAVAAVCLNLTEPHFRQIAIPELFSSSFDANRIHTFRASKNRGFAFACIVFNAPKYSPPDDITEWLSEALHRSGLPALDNINREACFRLDVLSRDTRVRWDLDRTRDYLLELGRTICFMRSSQQMNSATLQDLIKYGLPLPPMFDADCQIFGMSKERVDSGRFDPESMHSLELDLQGFTANFLMACRGVRP